MSENPIYHAQLEELAELRIMYQETPHDVEELTERVVNRLHSITRGVVSKINLTKLFTATKHLPNVAEFARRVDETTHPDAIVEGARTVRLEGLGKRRIVGPEQLDILHKSRSVNLHPLEATDALSEIEISCIGLSAIAPSLEGLVAAGAKHVRGADPGILAASNSPRNVGEAGLVRNSGRSKADALSRTLYERYPYGHFDLRPGRVVATDGERSSEADMTYRDIFTGAELVIEVIDDPRRKAQIAEFARQHFPQTLIMFVADLADDPIAGLSRASMGNHFNQKIRKDILTRMADPAGGIDPLSKVVAMIGEHLPYEHGLDFLLFGHEKKYWSQLPSSARELAGLVTNLVIAHLAGKDVLSHNYSPATAPRHLMGELDEEAQQIYKRVMRKRFRIK